MLTKSLDFNVNNKYCVFGEHGWRKRVAQAGGASGWRIVPIATEKTKPSLVGHVSCARVPRVNLSCAPRVFLRVLWFSSLSKVNTHRTHSRAPYTYRYWPVNVKELAKLNFSSHMVYQCGKLLS